MEALVLDPTRLPRPEQLIGAVIVEEVNANGRRVFHKGHRLTAEDLQILQTVDRPVHAVRLAPTDVHEDEASLRLARAIAGPGLDQKGPRQSRINLIAAHKGLLRIDAATLHRLNCLPGVAIFTLLDRLSVLPGTVVAGVKIAPVAIDRTIIEEAEAIAAAAGPVIQVKAFRPLKVGVISTEGLEGRVRDRFRETVTRKIGWYGGTVLGFADLPNDASQVAEAIERFIAEGADLILTGGGNTIDPLDAALQALPRIGAEIVSFGVASHPGSMLWLAYRGDVPIFNLASCSMYSKSTSADLILPWIMAGERVTTEDIASIGHGGLLERGMDFRFPPYDAEQAPQDEGE
ncbi:MAG TPA: molybdopterin-binding protein [Thermomicrobiales bacterium]